MAGTLVLCSGAVSRSCSPFSRRVCSEEGELTVSEVARRLGIGQGAVIHWINRGWLPARRGLNDRWCIPFDPAVEAQCRDRVARSVHIPRLDSSEPPDDNELTVAEVAAALDISTNVVYYWIERHHVRTRRRPRRSLVH